MRKSLLATLMQGNIDISVASLVMTTERENVIDFVNPYFDQGSRAWAYFSLIFLLTIYHNFEDLHNV
jgi:ABC-type amino acid transport substrate-binding protein